MLLLKLIRKAYVVTMWCRNLLLKVCQQFQWLMQWPWLLLWIQFHLKAEPLVLVMIFWKYLIRWVRTLVGILMLVSVVLMESSEVITAVVTIRWLLPRSAGRFARASGSYFVVVCFSPRWILAMTWTKSSMNLDSFPSIYSAPLPIGSASYDIGAWQ